MWQIVGVATAVIVAGLLAHPAVSAALAARPSGTASTFQPAAAISFPAAPPSPISPSPYATSPAATPRSATTVAASPAQQGAAAAPTGAPLAGRIKPGVAHTGVATFYQGAQNSGACLFDRSPDHFTAAMNEKDFEGSKACGAYVQVRGSNGATITVRITNLCPYPCRVGQLDLDPEAYKLLAPPQTGETPITWKLVSPAISGGIAIRYKSGSSQWWCGIQVINHRNPVARLEVRTAGRWKALPRSSYNYFLSANGAGCGADLRVTDIYGQALVVRGLPVKANVTQPTNQQFAKH
ncbi:expansin EXLX1 family cellulose-binding protein [Actinoplanes subtropicus]|uniref:expansin EXLX1 family cellulose-binding protein n=1 Tax=Actinoplanes subtropicus TaxID=543632 RepID=UPI0004C3CC5E|nr:expansin EXLX1 family cellulose-binding protein [Actinoplanes subtropicus]